MNLICLVTVIYVGIGGVEQQQRIGALARVLETGDSMVRIRLDAEALKRRGAVLPHVTTPLTRWWLKEDCFTLKELGKGQ